MELTDYSSQVWRTLGNWSRLTKSSDLDLSRLELALVTNGSVQPGSALSKLTLSDATRDVPGPVKRLRRQRVLRIRKSAKDREDFISLGEAAQFSLIQETRIFPNSPNLAALGSEIEEIPNGTRAPLRTRRLVG